jgi:hypothetical protein
MIRKLGQWIVYTAIFVVFGGIGAGITHIIFALIVGQTLDSVLYAVIFGGAGWIAYRQAEGLLSPSTR